MHEDEPQRPRTRLIGARSSRIRRTRAAAGRDGRTRPRAGSRQGDGRAGRRPDQDGEQAALHDRPWCTSDGAPRAGRPRAGRAGSNPMLRASADDLTVNGQMPKNSPSARGGSRPGRHRPGHRVRSFPAVRHWRRASTLTLREGPSAPDHAGGHRVGGGSPTLVRPPAQRRERPRSDRGVGEAARRGSSQDRRSPQEPVRP